MPPESTLLSESEFDELCKSSRFKTFKVSSFDLAKLMWVDGLSPGAAGKKLNMSRQSASALAKRLEAARASVPEGWVLLHAYVPPELEREVLQRLKSLHAADG